MAEDFYNDMASPAPSAVEGSEEQGKTETSTIPKSLCPGMKVGDSVELKIVGELDSEYEVAYEEETETDEAPEMEEEMAPPPTAMPQAPGMSDMMG